jgi:peptide/nickel transport system substrate-binding protein
VVPLFNNYVFANSIKVTHAKRMANNWSLDGNRALERWWFA